MKTTVCTCSFCRKGEYDPSEYMVDIAGFAKERPVGVSGLMRVKNEARWVAQSIDTCIDALDELIICYQSCSDETPWIIEQKRRQYPDKIKVFFYAPPVFSHDLSEEEYGYACSLPEDSIHLLSNYYNYTLSKATYRYAMKIDADQIYFPERMIRLCDAYRSLPVKRKTISACLAFGYYRLFLSLSRRCPRFFFKTLDFLPFGNIVMEKYETYLYVQISQTKQPVALSGINLYKEKEEWKIPAYAECHEYMLSFNGNGDLVVFAISDKSYYTPFARPVDLKNFYTTNRMIEFFHREGPPPLFAGFYWYHMKFVGLEQFNGFPLCGKIEVDSFFRSSLSRLIRLKLLNYDWIFSVSHLFFFVYDKKIPRPENLIKQ